MSTSTPPKIVRGYYQLPDNTPQATVYIAFDGTTYGFGGADSSSGDKHYYSLGVIMIFPPDSTKECQFNLVPCGHNSVAIDDIRASHDNPHGVTITKIWSPDDESPIWRVRMPEISNLERCSFTLKPKGKRRTDDPQIIITPGGG